MSDLLNSSFVNRLLSMAYSQLGKVLRMGILIGLTWISTKLHLEGVNNDDTAGKIVESLSPYLVGAWAVFEAWLMSRFKRGVKVMQAQVTQGSPIDVKIDGIPGNQTVNAASDSTGVSVVNAIDKVNNP
jgi:hypothetical protein